VRWGKMHLGSYVFFSFGERWGCLISFVPKVFLWSSHCVPIMLPEFKSSNSYSFYPISIALSFILVTYISSPKEEIITYLIWGFQKLDCFSLCPNQRCLSNRKIMNFMGPHNYLIWVTNMYVLLVNINVKYLHCCSPDFRSIRLQNCNKVKQSFDVWLSFAF
jgi:hypothetical protein